MNRFDFILLPKIPKQYFEDIVWVNKSFDLYRNNYPLYARPIHENVHPQRVLKRIWGETFMGYRKVKVLGCFTRPADGLNGYLIVTWIGNKFRETAMVGFTLEKQVLKHFEPSKEKFNYNIPDYLFNEGFIDASYSSATVYT